MKKHSKNKQSIQLELPFAKSTYKNNINNFIIREIILNYSEQKDKDDSFYWFDQYLPLAKDWDKRSLKRFIAEIWVTSSCLKIYEVFATSEKMAKQYLEKNFCLAEIYSVPDFATNELNEEISHEFKQNKIKMQKIYDA
tara:strand:- start:74 stop:490 length:417 start_codon:yes stop_codon:yes gene_type:complete